MSISGCGALELPNVNLFLFDMGGAKLFNQNIIIRSCKMIPYGGGEFTLGLKPVTVIVELYIHNHGHWE